MAPTFGTFNLGEVLKNAEQIKGFQRQSRFQDLQELAMTENIESTRQTRDLQQKTFDAATQRANTEKLLVGVQLAKQNPSVLPQLLDGLAGDGILDPQAVPQILQLSQTDPQKFNAMLDDLGANLQYALSQPPEKPKETTDTANYAKAVEQGFTGTLVDYQTQMKRAGATTVDARQMGAPPPGYRVEYDEHGRPSQMVAIPGSPAAVDAETAEKKTEQQQQSTAKQSDLVAQEIDRSLEIMEGGFLPDTGAGSWLSGVPGTDAKALSNLFKTIKANVGFAHLQKMRTESPTGGALGNVSNFEVETLQALAGSLDQSQSKEQLTYNLNRLWNSYQDAIHGPNDGPTRRPLNVGNVRIASEDDYNALPSGTKYIDPDGKERIKN